MEKEKLYMNNAVGGCWNSEMLGKQNWEDPFESAVGGSIVLRELVGRLGSICNSGDCFNFNGPPKLNPIPHHPNNTHHSFMPGGGSQLENAELGDSTVEGSSASASVSQQSARKRKTAKPNFLMSLKNKVKMWDLQDNGESKAKRSKSEGNEKQTKAPEPPKDYIHVRARRGQATDSHSLAERVRREKISERMTFLQDLVPGCNKVTGKAVMLDEIINYVQSLQRQVEFLSMKLSTVNPRMEFSMEALLSKDIFQSQGSVHHNTYPVDTSAQGLLYGYPSQQGSNLHCETETPFSMNPSLNSAIRQNPNIQLHPIDAFSEAAAPQDLTFWDDDLQSVVQMGFGQNQAQNCHGTRATSQMKLEL